MQRFGSKHGAIVDIRLNRAVTLLAELKRRTVKYHEIDLHLVFAQKRADSRGRDGERNILRKTVDAGGDQRKRDAPDPLPTSQRKRVVVTGGEELGFAFRSAAPDRADRVDDVFCGQRKAAREHDIARLAIAYLRAGFGERFRACRGKDCAANAAAHQQLLVCRVDDGVYAHHGDIVSNNLQRHALISLSGIVRGRNVQDALDEDARNRRVKLRARVTEDLAGGIFTRHALVV